ncbi:hypothetical protein A6V39_00800 [Candidatus Mycoplasma haematobovis]|uniref:Uncharacterized protein n=1 Tax=Candidatus Mycoplasma haematobovis TaxID=432608 RepID=A0A1A9QFW5_9MOLU|nr:hypothetical protein [Candidatus Mycoplasma haematobovis]OAL10590.1 hypothetical protein A6V39_00800 [Candidatus Mycoplasma haematobovis]
MTLGGKVVAVATTLGTIGGGVALTNHLITPTKPLGKTTSERLTSEGFDVNVTDWQTIFNAYNNNQNTHLFSLNNGEQKSKETLERKCQAALSERDAKDTTYKLAKRWCVKEEAVGVILGKLQLNVLKTETDEDNETHWSSKVERVKDILDVASKLGVLKTADENTNITKIKQECAKIIKFKTTSAEFDEKFKLAKEWCSA